jgi:hypothetical protein
VFKIKCILQFTTKSSGFRPDNVYRDVVILISIRVVK